MRARIRKFASGLSQYLILESKIALLIRDMGISKLTVHMQKVENGERKQTEFGDRQGEEKQFCSYPHWDYCDKGKDKYFKCGQAGHHLRDCPVNKVATGESKIIVALSSAPTPGGLTSNFVTIPSSSIGRNRLYALASRQELEASADVIIGYSWGVWLICRKESGNY
ncbi:uncharacterized protein LOC107841515 [Capsicum annuum]|uniref:uncharacterized protein LOC107841515 n=1 Tax=Capsicum annuum TaxID=4072 RepID=UPI001FB146F6|nr:uncharacterized protein LOC107841515 [Capsicum annuum]